MVVRNQRCIYQELKDVPKPVQALQSKVAGSKHKGIEQWHLLPDTAESDEELVRYTSPIH